MSRDIGGDPTFPGPYNTLDSDLGEPVSASGLTIRDWIAVTIGAGMVANPNDESSWAGTAEAAYRAADAFLKARSKSSP